VTRRPLTLWLAALVAMAALATALPAVAAQGGGTETTRTQTAPTRTTETATTESGTTGDKGTAGDNEEQDDDALVALGVLVFGALVLAMTLLYLDAWRRSAAELIKETLAGTGQLPEYEAVAAAVPEAGARGAPAEEVRLNIRGPALVHVGHGSRFRALQDGAAVSADWAVEPPEAGRTEPTSGAQTTVTPARLGPLAILATAGGVTSALHAVAVAAPRRVGRIPLVGVGYGGITIAIIALTLAGAATMYGKLDGAALVAIAGAIVGYFFVEARAQQAGASGGAGAAAGDGGDASV
jgi:hypothetical protein